MYEKQFIDQAVRHSTPSDVDRRKLFTMLGVAGAGAAAVTLAGASAAQADDASDATDAAVLNFALNLEYLEAEFYLRAVTGRGLLRQDSVDGTGRAGAVYGGKEVPFKSRTIERYAREIAQDERDHVRFLRAALGSSAVRRPQLSFDAAFTAAARAAGVVGPKEMFNAFDDETSFLLGAFVFEDVGVTAYKGAAGLIANKTYLDAAAGILAVEAYHAGAVRSLLFAEAEKDEKLYGIVQKLSDARDALAGTGDDDQGIRHGSAANITPTDENGIAYGRTTGQVLDIVYLNTTGKPVSSGGFYPNGFNGAITTSA